MSDLTQLYQEIILDHNKHPRNYGPLEEYSGKASVNNPLCGDEVDVFWKLEDGMFTRIAFTSRGCAISRASASMMTSALQGRSRDYAERLFERLKNALTEEENEEPAEEEFGELMSLMGVRQYPSRIRCATLAWHALLDKI
ncbi:MAG: SUF system NifU family Fe-S cluster assembly protein [Verrucomicrobiae bacterium]|nr:SUF system NifU family Fe-S cluster assembly protein [Verrucomicrobiae bacterium]